MRSALKSVTWKSLLIVVLAAFGLRWMLDGRTTPAASPPKVIQTSGAKESEESQVQNEENSPETCGDSENSGPLVFDQDPVEVRPRPEEDQVETTFTFTNQSDKPVTVTDIESTCSCLEATVDKVTYGPGEKGKGKAVFKVSSFVGRHEKTLHLHTDNPEAPEQVLTFILDVPVVVSIEPNFLEWVIGEAPEPKEMTIKMLGSDPINISKITSTRENVRHELKEVSAGREYRLIVTPANTENVTVGAFKLETDSKIPKYARQMAFFSIVRPELAEKRKAAEKPELKLAPVLPVTQEKAR